MADKPKKLQRSTDYAAIRRDAQAEISKGLNSDQAVEPDLEDLEDLEDEVGLDEVYLDEAALDAIPAEDVDLDEAEPEIISDLPQEFTESYGTGLQGQPSDRTGRGFSQSQTHMLDEPSSPLIGGDEESNYDDTDAVGEEAVGGTVSTPDQDIVDDLAAAAGVEIDDRTDLRIRNMLEERDDRRWELDPQSAEDYSDR
ncbi:MAG TPA: DUF6335 family protein [Coleofasciculaceae cyanobacterium]